MRIWTSKQTPEDYTVRVNALLSAETTHVYFDTSFLMWLTMTGDQSRQQFKAWAASLGERTHVPLWSMHEYHRHHIGGTLKANLSNSADDLMKAAKAFQQEVRRHADQPFVVGQSEAGYQDSVSNAIETLKELSDAARHWDYEPCASDVITWMNSRACRTRTVFQSMATLETRGAARYTQDLPPGFLDRRKEDTPTRGSNRFGDLLFWEEVVQHARSVDAKAVIIVTRDRKEDWYVDDPAPEVTGAWQRLGAKWLPVPKPHPTLAFELQIEANAELVLLDELYLGAVLWKFGRPQYERFAATAISVSPDRFERAELQQKPVLTRAAKRLENSTIGLVPGLAIIAAALGPPDERVSAILQMLDQDAPAVDLFIEQLGVDTFAPLSNGEAANFACLVHSRAKLGTGPAVTVTSKLLDLLDQLPADTAAASYIGALCSAYFDGEHPLPTPYSPFLQDLFAWQTDTAMTSVIRAFNIKMSKVNSAALYWPGKRDPLILRIEHDARQQQDPVLLTQAYLGTRALLTDGEVRPLQQLHTLVGTSEASIREIASALSRHYGLPPDQLQLEGGEPDDRRLVPDGLGLREFDRFARVGPAPAGMPAVDDAEADNAEPDDVNDEDEDDLLDELEED